MRGPYLEAKLDLEQAVKSLAVGTSIRVVYTLIGAHDVARASFDGVLKGPRY